MNQRESDIVRAFRTARVGRARGALLTVNEEGDRAYDLEGLLCEVYRLEFPGDVEWVETPSRPGTFMISVKGQEPSALAPYEAYVWAGLHGRLRLPYPVWGYSQMSLLSLSDSVMVSFKECANILEHHYSTWI